MSENLAEPQWGLDDAVQTLAVLRRWGLTPAMTKWIWQGDGQHAAELIDWLSKREAGLPAGPITAPAGAIVIPPIHPSKETLVRAYQSQFASFWRSPDRQVETMRQMAGMKSASVFLELSDELRNGVPSPTVEPQGPFQVLVLCFGANEYADTLILADEMRRGRATFFDEVMPREFIARTHLAPGKFHKRGLYWAVIDVGTAVSSQELQEVPQALAGVEVLFALAMQTQWCKAMAEGEMPRVVIGGLRYRGDHGEKKVFALDQSGSPGKLRLQTYPPGEHIGVHGRAVPIVIS